MKAELYIHTSRPVCATICAVRKDGNPKKVMMGFLLDLKALSKRKCGLTIEVIMAVRKRMYTDMNIQRRLVKYLDLSMSNSQTGVVT